MGNGMRWSFAMLPDYPLQDSIEMIRTADELGYYAAYAADETWHKDLWVLFAAAADKTENIRMGPNVTHVFLREPTLICQATSTLDELTGGRAELLVSTGNFGLMQQHGVDWANRKPLSRLKEAIHVMRTFFADGAITFQGDFFTYNGLFTFSKPVQDPMPIRMGGMKGPRSYETAGEIADGLHTALAYSPEAYEYVAKHVRIGCERAGRDFDSYDLGAWVVTVVSEDGAAAKHAARILCAFYISSMPEELIVRNGLDPADLAPVVAALGEGDVPKAVELFRPEFAEKLSVAGTPEEVVEKIQRDIQPSGVNHMILALSDAALVKAFSGEDVANVPDIQGQLRLVAEQVMPAFEPAVA